MSQELFNILIYFIINIIVITCVYIRGKKEGYKKRIDDEVHEYRLKLSYQSLKNIKNLQ